MKIIYKFANQYESLRFYQSIGIVGISGPVFVKDRTLKIASMAELVDALDSKSSFFTEVPVRSRLEVQRHKVSAKQ